MKNEELYNSISNIDPSFLDEADNFITKSKKIKSNRLKRLIAAAACLCLIITGTLMLFPNKNIGSPFALYAYAMDENGEPKKLKMSENDIIQLPEITLPCGSTGFIFIVETKDLKKESNVYILSKNDLTKIDQKIIDDIQTQEWYEKNGINYFYFIPSEDSASDNYKENILIFDTEADGYAIEYYLLFTKESDTYTATLKETNEYSAESTNILDNTDSIKTDKPEIYVDKPGSDAVIYSYDDEYVPGDDTIVESINHSNEFVDK